VTGAGGLRGVAAWVWEHDSASARAARVALSPLAMLFGAMARGRVARIEPQPTPIPVLSVGNLSVGGTGKTPMASWFARALQDRGARPALVLRGYGDDEWRVHELLTPAVPVLRGRERAESLRRAVAMGCDVAVLDDGFQHRQVARVSDVVLVSADRWPHRLRLLPAGPYREPLSALGRASAVVVTVKAAPPAVVQATVDALAAVVPADRLAVVQLRPDALVPVIGAAEAAGATSPARPRVSAPLATLAGEAVAVVTAIADSDAFARQLIGGGARVTVHHRFPDHHAFDAADVARVSTALHGAGRVVCTLKDAVKLGPLWPRAAAPLWYVSQTVVVERGAEVLARECDRVLVARATAVPTAG